MWSKGSGLKDIAKELTSKAGKMKDADNCTVLLVSLNTESKSARRGSVHIEHVRRGSSGSSRRSSRRSSISSFRESIMDLMK